MSARAAVVAALLAGPAVAAEPLTLAGATLAPLNVPLGEAAVVTVDVGEDAVLAVHAVLRPASSNRSLARDMDGYWAPWDGDVATLPASAAVRDGAQLTFKLFERPPAGFSQPFRVTVAYRTAEGLKFGVLDVTAAGETLE